MFAYCLNNPVCYTDETGHAAGGRTTTVAICDGGGSNWAGTYIDNQRAGYFSKWTLGCGTVGIDGCALIAIHNVLTKLNCNPTMHEVYQTAVTSQYYNPEEKGINRGTLIDVLDRLCPGMLVSFQDPYNIDTSSEGRAVIIGYHVLESTDSAGYGHMICGIETEPGIYYFYNDETNFLAMPLRKYMQIFYREDVVIDFVLFIK